MSCILHVGNSMKYDCGRIFIDGLNPDDTSQSLLSASCDSDKYGFICQQIGMKFIIGKSCLHVIFKLISPHIKKFFKHQVMFLEIHALRFCVLEMDYACIFYFTCTIIHLKTLFLS